MSRVKKFALNELRENPSLWIKRAISVLNRQHYDHSKKPKRDKWTNYYTGFVDAANDFRQRMFDVFKKVPSMDTIFIIQNDFDYRFAAWLYRLGYRNFIFIHTEADSNIIRHYKLSLKTYLFALMKNDDPDYAIIEELAKQKLYYYKDEEIIKMSKENKQRVKILSNPPYEKGHEITKFIIDNYEYDEFVDLEPISDFKGKEDKLWQHIEKVCVIPWIGENFDDASTNPHIYNLCKHKNNTTYAETEALTFDRNWIKYYQEQTRRAASWKTKWSLSRQACLALDRNKTFALTVRTFVDGVHKTQDCFDYIYNMTDADITTHESIKENAAGAVLIPWSIFDTPMETKHCREFWYNSKIMTPIVKGYNKQSLSNTTVILPKVDYIRRWNDAQVLAEYGYTKEENIAKLLSVGWTQAEIDNMMEGLYE